MSATTPTTVPLHALVLRLDSRGRGVYHAALPNPEPGSILARSWRTACGRELPAAGLNYWWRDAAEVQLALPTHAVCAGCMRVGDAVDA